MAKQHELVQLQDDVAAEVTRDAPTVARMVFGDNASHPDITQVSNERLDDLYRQKFLANDRPWLQAEARRDPEQFLKVAERIGVQKPPPPAPVPPLTPAVPASPPAFPSPPLLTPPGAVVAPTVPVAEPAPLAPAAAPAVILGPNGMPLPPSGMV